MQDKQIETVLLVDDSPVNLQILSKLLDGCGYELLQASDGHEALAMARRTRPSLILLDIMMPGMDGYEVCELLKADPMTRDIAVIFLSALEDTDAKLKGFAVGGVDYIAKPFQSDEVVARVRNHVRMHRLERQLAVRNFQLVTENQQILNAISEGIIGLDRNGRITMLNPAASTILGWSAPDCIGEPLEKLALFDTEPGHHLAEYQTLPYRAYRLGRPSHSDMEMVRSRSGKIIPTAISCAPRAEGGAVVVLRDISEWAESEEALRQAREQLESQRQHMAHMERLSTTGEMAAGIAHEVNQPLTAIVNYSRVLRRMLAREDVSPERLAQLLEKIDTQAVRASDVIQRMRSYIKKPGRGAQRIDPNVLIGDVIALAEVDSRINDISIHFEPQMDLPALLVDPVQLQQVALNLIRNAMEAMANSNQRELGVVVSTRREADSVVFEIIDAGSGVDEALRERLFEPFLSTKPGGMGVGLSISQSIVQAHGGKIGFQQNASGGTTFYFSIPCAGDEH